MNGWRHVEKGKHLPWPYDGLVVCSAAGCVCVIPTPDPASPCGVCNQGTVMCFYTNTHTYQPTRCTCGHPIEPTPGGTR